MTDSTKQNTAKQAPAVEGANNSMQQKAAADAAPAEKRLHDLAPEIRKQWTTFSNEDLAGVKGQDDLTAKVEKTYALLHDDAKKQVQTWAQGRQSLLPRH